ncbi:PQQ-binding-like beta-propeller repeat protein [Haladaptatus sp. DYF46]|uniref:outer membrane protein assembly factor BamB family protein n=1 Tax=Haladaptatus sp. DYF46 TaxID=2886041 RepID=UPI001E58258E|nr:PQQ-binding-like beta-propeller repeat protein [Haladaptatus sp. DYF46]
MSKNNLDHGGHNRRTFLKTVGITLGAAGLESTTVDSQETPGTPASGWNTRRGSSIRTGVINGTGPVPYPMPEWKTDLNGTIFGYEPVVSDGTLYLPVTTENSPPANEGFVGAYDIETGTELWRQSTFPRPETPTVSGEEVYVTTEFSESNQPQELGIYALDRGSGDISWSRTQEPDWAETAVNNDLVLLANTDGAVALDPPTGDLVWETPGVGGLSSGFDGFVCATDETVVYADGTALDPEDGSVLWVIEDEPILGDPGFRGGLVVFIRTELAQGQMQVSLEARSEQTGELEWSYVSPDNRWGGDHALTENCVVIVEATGETSSVIGLDLFTGEEKYRTEIPLNFASSPAGDDERVYIGGQYIPKDDTEEPKAAISTLERSSGDLLWTYLFDDSGLPTSPENPPAAGTPALSNGQLVAGTYPGGSTLDYEYLQYSNFFTFGTSESPPDGYRPPNRGKSDDGESEELNARIDAPSNQDLSDLSPGEKVLLNGSSSTGTDPTYEWDTDGDGQYDTSGQSVRVTVPACTSLTVTLRVTNPNGDTDTATATVSPN